MRNKITILTALALSVFLSTIVVFGGDVKKGLSKKRPNLTIDKGIEKPYPGLSMDEQRKLREKSQSMSSITDEGTGKKGLEDNPPGLTLMGCDELLSDSALTLVGGTYVYGYNQIEVYWSAIGLRPDAGSDWDISLYSDTCGTGTEMSWSWSYEDSVEFVVADYNHCPLGWEGIWVDRWAGTGNATLEYDDFAYSLIVGANTGLNWPAGDVVEIWDIYLEPGDYTFSLVITAGTADLGIALFESNGAEYYAGRWEAALSADATGPGGPEDLSFSATQADWYGFLAWANNADAADFDIYIGSTGIGDENGTGPAIPSTFALSQNYPNPFNPSTVISYQLSEMANVTLKIHDIRGRVITELVNGAKQAGRYNVQWNGKDTHGQIVPSGVYFYVLNTNKGFNSTKKMVVLK